MSEPIEIEGLRAFGRDLKKLDNDFPKLVRVALNQSAALVVKRARPKIPARSGKAARSLKAKSTRTLVRVSAGSRRVPYYGWLDFGGRVGRKRGIRRKFLKEGRYIYPAYRKLKASGEFAEVMEANLVDVARQAGIEIE